MGAGSSGHGRARRLLGHAVYWAAVVAVSLALVVGLLLFLESRDASTVETGVGPDGGRAAVPSAIDV